MAVGLGVNSYLQMKKETSFGVNPGGTFVRIPFVSEGLALDIGTIPSATIVKGAARNALIYGGKSVSGPINMEALYTAMDQFLLGCLGLETQTTPVGGVSSRDHWFGFATTLPSFSIEVDRGDIPAADKVFSYLGQKVNAIEFSWTAPNVATFTAEVVGKTESSPAAGDTASTSTTRSFQAVLPGVATAYDIGTGAAMAYTIGSGRIRVARGLTNDRFALGDKNPKEPLVTDFAEVTGEFVLDFEDRLAYNDFTASTEQTSGNIKFVSDTVIEGVLKYELEFKINRFAYTTPAVALVEGPGILRARIPWIAFGNAGVQTDGTGEPMAVRLRNANLNTSY